MQAKLKDSVLESANEQVFLSIGGNAVDEALHGVRASVVARNPLEMLDYICKEAVLLVAVQHHKQLLREVVAV